jgi:phosphoglycolate phosphatase-like HAD superfamily hydrolase
VTDVPAWLLDVDGVVNASRPGWHAAPFRAQAAAYGQTWPIRWAPALVARIRDLIDSGAVEVRWCSTWCGQTGHLERVLGLPALESAIVVPPDRFVGELKAQAARNVLASGRRLVWTDDMEVPDDGPLHDELTADGRALLIRPDRRRGLTPEHMDQAEAFCQAAVGG